jgi:penicillin amidase
MSLRRLLGLVVLLVGTGALLYGLQVRIPGGPAVSTILDPADGLYRTARQATPPADSSRLTLPGLDQPVRVVRDERHVPHIFAESDRDAIIALGYVAAKDRLFQLDFLPRVASGRLSAAFGPQSIRADRFLRRTGMEWGAQRNLERIRAEKGIELKALRWYGTGVNAYLDRTAAADLPLVFRLLGYRPDRYTPIQGLRLLQYMSYDLSYDSDDPSYTTLRRRLGADAFERLYPEHPAGLFVPIVPPAQQRGTDRNDAAGRAAARPGARAPAALRARRHGRAALRRALGGSTAGIAGSNNWAVQDRRSESGAPLLAGDMHLSVTLPSIWYEAHLVTPTTNAYGLTIPGAPVLVQAFNRHVGWTLTNTGADLIDHYALTVDSARARYRYEGTWRPLRRTVDTIRVKGQTPVLDTMYFSHHGPVRVPEGETGTAVAEQWVAHKPSRTLHALWDMNRADSVAALTEALRRWDTPMQNILYAGTGGDIAIRSVGRLPVRRAGHGRGLLPGSTDAHEWVGRVPFDALPAARNPAQDFLASANQKPTGPGYPYYLGYDWPDGYRSMRIDSLLRGRGAHGVDDFTRYQTDVQVPSRSVFVPLLRTVGDVSPRADTLRRMLVEWDGEAAVDRPEPLIFRAFLRSLRRQAWDERVFAAGPDPEDAVLVDLLRTDPDARWLDVQATPATEGAPALLRRALEATADTMASRHGWTPEAWRWGAHHRIQFRHMSGSEQLRPLWRGPHAFPGFASTVLQAPGNPVTHSASQRVVVDFSTSPPSGYGVVPGGQRGTPLDPAFYDTQIPTYLEGRVFDLRVPAAPPSLSHPEYRSTRVLRPGEGE